jgi:Glycosyl hydrolases family 2, sugar binding domain/Glycosyl hydrolases family 2, TIM barrel domain/Glycosyl hydrolases family 2
MIRSTLICVGIGLFAGVGTISAADTPIPKPEHPRPDAMRATWANLNGRWEFRFDATDQGLRNGWEKPDTAGYDRTIVVPFPWESKLSGIHQPKDAPVIGWYRRQFTIPKDFPPGDRVWLRFGAVDWRADVWVNGQKVVEHEGGYTPFEADISDTIKRDGQNVVIVRAFDPTDPALPTGKQVGWYTPSSGIWQTVWLEARPKSFIADFTMIPAINPAKVDFQITVAGLPKETGFQVAAEARYFEGGPKLTASRVEKAHDGSTRFEFSLPVPEPMLWTPETPHLYDVTLKLSDLEGKVIDSIQSYFGLRTIGHGKYGDEPFERILLNGKPIFLSAALDQSFNPDGIYTAPDDDFLKRDMVIAKSMGLNGLRIHIKPDEPRRLFWADRYGVLILQDMPNTWRQNARARKAWEQTMREDIVRDRNHPSIITWIAFNETWGLGDPEEYKKDRDTQKWVSEVVQAIRALDPSRLVEDNSPCYYDHVDNTDLNSWHFYIDDHERARRHIENVVAETKAGSPFNYCPGLSQSTVPLINSEYGAVSAGSGDRDISWGLRDLTTQLRRHPKIQGYIYTELSDIEWEHNGLVNYDRSAKKFGYDTWVPDMRPNELLGADFIGYDSPPAIVGKPGQTITVPIFVSHYSERTGPPKMRWWASGYDSLGDSRMVSELKTIPITWKPYGVVQLEPLKVTLPDYPLVGALVLTLRDQNDKRIAANFVNLVVRPDTPLPRIRRRGPNEVLVRFAPGDFAHQHWSEPVKSPPGKVYGYGKGYFEYRLELPPSVVKAHPESFYFLFQAASKAKRERVDWPERVNKQDYPQTDATRAWPSTMTLSVNGRRVDRIELPDDAADARGVLSHLAGVEHGSHGELADGLVTLTDADRARLEAGEPLLLRLAVANDATHAGGLCLFGANTGELPMDPTLQIRTRDPLPADLGVDRNAKVAVPAGP